jgi:hypothetical protein
MVSKRKCSSNLEEGATGRLRAHIRDNAKAESGRGHPLSATWLLQWSKPSFECLVIFETAGLSDKFLTGLICAANGWVAWCI